MTASSLRWIDERTCTLVRSEMERLHRNESMPTALRDHITWALKIARYDTIHLNRLESSSAAWLETATGVRR